MVPDAAACLLRAGRGYELVAHERLTDAERAALSASDMDDVPYGVLRPRPGSGHALRTASPDTALLFLTLGEPGRLPAYARTALAADAADTVARLVLDGVLELEFGGAWYTGARASALLDPGDHDEPPRGRIGALSVAALRYGEQLGDLPEDVLALRLYGYGRRPIGPQLYRALPDDVVEDALGIGQDGEVRRTLGRAWDEQPSKDGRRHWMHWRPRGEANSARARRANVKLYVSPTVEALGEAMRVLANLLAVAPSPIGFKTGADLGGVCRPDKIVLYFDRLDELQATADELARRLAGLPAHGVPFTSAVTDDGLLSWAADPATTSWRIWVATRLAERLVQARRAPDGTEPWRYALHRLRLDGVDTHRWTWTHRPAAAAG